MWLGERRGHLIDWSTQLWVRSTGRHVDFSEENWLLGPVGTTRGVGRDFFDKWAATEQLTVTRHRSGKGLLSSFAALAGSTFDPSAVDSMIAEFYESTSEFEIDVWSEWNRYFRPFGRMISAIFSRRLEQLNLPLSPMDSSWGMTSEIVQVRDRDGEVRASGWVRTSVKTGRVVYAGSYSVATPSGFKNPCVKTVFPLPNGNAIVILRPEALPDGSLALVSEGRRFGDPGFYFTARDGKGICAARYVRSFRERIHVFRGVDGSLRTDHFMSLWGRQCLHLHYRLRRMPPRSPPVVDVMGGHREE